MDAALLERAVAVVPPPDAGRPLFEIPRIPHEVNEAVITDLKN
ncbi:MAG: hypothetical protein AVDCRST_MAG19-4466 [uncultured Thermomicrobiales bacterium]|uniref:Uncharacterized protein n=1 Tax=uncultured Thermomicrobiales bacterium TaxID=1645740 RepID=A0A6J4VQR6_9BACT|nr:MAG: hypothetical protein AVDCRST_MAG19-4466 [uncultured Thermomicrobiales bacterium]